jgi:cytochrome oxidase Cu insertion factor (SCO1/SenC/PrrC family)
MWRMMEDVKAERLAIVLLMLLGACGGPSQSDTSAPASETPVSEAPRISASYAAPDFRVTTFEGSTFQLKEQAGTPVVLNFWESW